MPGYAMSRAEAEGMVFDFYRAWRASVPGQPTVNKWANYLIAKSAAAGAQAAADSFSDIFEAGKEEEAAPTVTTSTGTGTGTGTGTTVTDDGGFDFSAVPWWVYLGGAAALYFAFKD